MAALEGTLQTPLGKIEKKTALIAGAGVAVLLGIVWYRQKKKAESQVVIGEQAINPATGYPYGSAEDAAALASQAAYITPVTGGGGGNTGGSGGYPSNLGYATNGQWVQAVVEYMVTHGLTEEPSQLSSALGKYVTGAPATDTDVDLIQQAIAAQGYPPVNGPGGYPPAINRQPTTPTPPTPPTTPTPPTAPVPNPDYATQTHTQAYAGESLTTFLLRFYKGSEAEWRRLNTDTPTTANTTWTPTGPVFIKTMTYRLPAYAALGNQLP